MNTSSSALATGCCLTVLAGYSSLPGKMSPEAFNSASRDSDIPLVERSRADSQFECVKNVSIDSLIPSELVSSDGVRVKLLGKPTCSMVAGQYLVLDGWGVPQLRFDSDFPREMMRQIKRLYFSSCSGDITPHDKKVWDFIVDQIDYGCFCELMAPAVYISGRLVSRTRNKATIRWADDEESIVEDRIMAQFSDINVDELFVCLVKFRQGRVDSVEHVFPVSERVSDADDSWIQAV